MVLLRAKIVEKALEPAPGNRIPCALTSPVRTCGEVHTERPASNAIRLQLSTIALVMELTNLITARTLAAWPLQSLTISFSWERERERAPRFLQAGHRKDYKCGRNSSLRNWIISSLSVKGFLRTGASLPRSMVRCHRWPRYLGWWAKGHCQPAELIRYRTVILVCIVSVAAESKKNGKKNSKYYCQFGVLTTGTARWNGFR